jgi:hypothetical protein
MLNDAKYRCHNDARQQSDRPRQPECDCQRSLTDRNLYAGGAIDQRSITQRHAQGNVDAVLAIIAVQPESESVIQDLYHNQVVVFVHIDAEFGTTTVDDRGDAIVWAHLCIGDSYRCG